MGKTKHLFSKDAVEKLKKMAGDGQILMFCCNLGTQPFDATPMSTQKVEEDGSIWFFSAKDSDRNKYLANNSKTQLLVGNQGDSEYLSIYGESEVLYDKQRAEELWTPMVKTWFQEGPTDPNLTLIKFKPSEGFYWDTKNGKMVAFAKMLASIATGETMDDSVEGKIML